MEKTKEIELSQLNIALTAVINQWRTDSTDEGLSRARQSISMEYANAIASVMHQVSQLSAEASSEQIQYMVLQTLADAILSEVDRHEKMARKNLHTGES